MRAAVSPSAAIVTAAGVGIGLSEHSVVLAVVLGAGAWLGRMAVAVAAAGRRRRKGQRPTADVDPWAVPEPWRQYVRQALASRQRFDQTVAQLPPGPVRDRLLVLQPRLWGATEEVWSVARRGSTLGGSTSGNALGGAPASVEALSTELRRVQAERAVASPSDRSVALARSEEAIAAQLRAAHRAQEVKAQMLDRLRLLTAGLDDVVTRVLELSLAQAAGGADGSSEAATGSVDALAEEITALQQGLQEASEASTGAGPAPTSDLSQAATLHPALPPSPPTAP
jgi:hypothetical protein